MLALDCSINPSTWGDCIKEALEFALGVVLGGLFDAMLTAIKWVVVESVKLVLNSIGTLWLKIDTIPLSQSSGTVGFVHNQTLWLVVAAGAVSMIFGGAQLAWHQRGEPAREVAKSLVTLLVVSAGGVAIVSALVQIADGLAQDVINARLKEDGSTFATRMGELVTNPLDGTGLAIVLVFGVTAIITCFVQIIMMIVRNGMLVLLVSVLPLAAAATNTEMGKAWFKKVISWLIAFIVYKPVAALIYAAALALAGNDDGNMMKVITGVVMMILAVIALPALIRLVAPKAG
jgi:hypothetical protein